LEGILSANHTFQGEERLILLHIGLFNEVEETHASLKKKKSVLERRASSTLSPWRIVLVFKNSFCKS
jgi:hypothetical protein